MKPITLPRLRLAQLQTVGEESLKITAGFAQVADKRSEANTAFERFRDAMKKDEANSDKQTLDRARDLLNTGLFEGVKSEQEYPHDEPTKKILDKIVKVCDKYGFALSRLRFDEQTAQTDNMLDELEAIDFGPLVQLSRWMPLIRAANERFKEGAGDYLASTVEVNEQEAATLLAPPLVKVLEQLYMLMFAHAQVSNDEELTTAYKKLVALVDAHR